MNRIHQQRRTAAGKSLESIVADANLLYRRERLAMMMPIHTGIVPAGIIRGRTAFFPAKKVWNDFVGFVAPNIPTLGECKNRISTTRNRKSINLINELRGKKDRRTGAYDWHQLASLRDFSDMGDGHAGVLLWSAFGGSPPIVSLHSIEALEYNPVIDREIAEACEVHWRRGVLDYLNLLEK